MNEIKTGDLLACRGSWFVSKLIRWWTQEEFSHVAIACWISFNGEPPKLAILESMEGSGVRILPFDRVYRTQYKGKTNAYMVHMPLEGGLDNHKTMAYIMQLWNQKYANWWQFIIIMSPRLQWLRKLIMKTTDTDMDRYHCSEIIAYALQDQGYQLPKSPELMTPGDITRLTCWGEGTKL